MVPQRRRRRRVIQQVGSGAWRLIVTRGPQGFGFTIAGQAPCVVSHVATDGPADRAGLRAGLAVVAVGASTVSRTPHDVVARLIAAAPQAIALTVTADREREPSDTSDDERVRPRTRHPQRPRARPSRTEARYQRDVPPKKHSLHHAADSLNPDFSSIASFPQNNHYNPCQSTRDALGCCSASFYQECPQDHNKVPLNNIVNIRQYQQNQLKRSELKLECRVVVGYLGTIETPSPIPSGSELNTVRTSIRKLRQEKRSSTLVLMTILPSTLNLKKFNGTILAEYTRDRIIYISSSSENDYRFFGLVTSTAHIDTKDNLFIEDTNDNIEVEISHSCHVFAVDPKLVDHNVHIDKATELRIGCTLDPVANHCLEFPASSEYVVGVIKSMYSLQIPNGVSSPALEQLSKLTIKSNSPAFGNISRRNNNRLAGLRGMRQAQQVNACVHNQRNDFPLNIIDNIRNDVQDFVSNSPQPSNHSEITTTSSNSDSGIGFHNDCHNIAERILVVDFDQQVRQHIVNGHAIIQNNYEVNSCKNSVKQRPLGIVDCNYDMDSSFLSNTMPVVDGFGGRGQPLNHVDDIISRVCDVQQPTCSFNNNVSNSNYSINRQAELIAAEAKNSLKDTYNYNNIHYGNLPSCSKDLYENHCINNSKDACPHYDPVYTETEGHHYEIIRPHLEIDPCKDFELVNEKFKAIDIYQENAEQEVIYVEKPADILPDYSIKSSNETESVDNMTIISSKSHDFLHSGKTSMDDISVYSSRSHEYANPSSNHVKKMQASVDDILMLGLGRPEGKNSNTNDDQNFVHPGTVKIKMRKKPMNLLSKTKFIFNGKDYKSKSTKSPTCKTRSRALSASVGDMCGAREAEEVLPATASSVPDLRDSLEHHSESEQTSPFRRWTTGSGTGSSYRHHDQRAMYNKQVSEGGAVAAKESCTNGGVTRWSLGLEHLLADPAGAAAFAEFLAKEFAAENIKFWWSCAEYASLPAQARAAAAQRVWASHLAEGAPDPVNVDAPARRHVADHLRSAPQDLFLQAQKQIFNLMKFHNYPRFLRSAEHAECARAELRGERSPFLPPAQPATPSKLKKSASNASECRRSGGSLLPWSRLRAVSRDREQAGDKQQQQDDTSASSSVPTSVPCSLCRVVLPDGATSVVGVSAAASVRSLVDRLLARRALHALCPHYDVLAPNTVDLEAPSTVLGGREARVERRCVFRLELEAGRAVQVRCRPARRLRHVLRPVLARYVPAAPLAAVRMRPPVSLDARVQDIDGSRLQVTFDETGSPPLYEDGTEVAEDGEIEGEIEDSTLRLQEESSRSCDGDNQSVTSESSRVRAALRPGPPLLPHPAEFLENLRQTQRARLQNTKPALAPPPLPPKARPHNKHVHNAASPAGALV